MFNIPAYTRKFNYKIGYETNNYCGIMPMENDWMIIRRPSNDTND